ncbi:MutS protein 1 [Coemansia javaensis]|uniref:MutS protein 1 n=1 Tax=Coemansia javaensis TaxID=2761396 RepID=A0A9W8H6E3_9FUNG|nr:MutS protein 1 [Coemansia javaensis]
MLARMARAGLRRASLRWAGRRWIGLRRPMAGRRAVCTAQGAEAAEDPAQLDAMGPGLDGAASSSSSSSSVLATVRECRQQYPGSVLLVRVGDFYELYYEQADEVGGDVLGLQVVDKKFRGGTVRFTGFPARSLLRYVELLVVRHGLSVALCEQFQEPGRRSFTRRVTRVLTPGTLIDDACLADTSVHSFILCIAAEERRRPRRGRPRKDAPAAADPEGLGLGLAWLDLATGDFMAGSTTAAGLSADLARIRPREILVSAGCAAVQALVEPARASAGPAVTRVPEASFEEHTAPPPDADQGSPDADQGSPDANPDPPEPQIAAPLNPNSQLPMSAPAAAASARGLLLGATELTGAERAAACALLNYVAATQLGLLPPLQPPRRYAPERHMAMSAATVGALELVRAGSGGSGAALLDEINQTRTSAGARLLATRLAAPSTSADVIEERLDLVEFFGAAPRVRDAVRARLGSVGDIERAVNKLSLNCGGPHDLLEIARSLREVAAIKRALADHLADRLDATQQQQPQQPRRPTPSAASHRGRPAMAAAVRRREQALAPLAPLVRDIGSRIRSDADRDLRAFGFLVPDCSAEITRLHALLAAKHRERHDLERQWRADYACASLRLDSIPALGHFIEVPRRDSARLAAAPEFRLVQTLRSRMRFENARWTHLLAEIELLRARLQAEELRVFEALRDRVLAASPAIRTNSRVLADLDVAISMAVLAAARQYTRPRLLQPEAAPHAIAGGRHPVVEAQLLAAGRQYVTNDCAFDSDAARVLLLTGPNMGGKSTYLRQVALTSILAQMGSFVPADRAELHIVDAIYSRIGAHDNLAQDQSTFMVEMAEAAHILTRATSRSLVILDEIGRGTATADGVAIAYATLRHLHDTVRCKTIFATHYHELVPHVVPALRALRALHTAVYEDDAGGFAFLHKVRPGVCRQSHALYVAQIAGVPKEVLAIARDFAALRQQEGLAPAVR